MNGNNKKIPLLLLTNLVIFLPCVVHAEQVQNVLAIPLTDHPMRSIKSLELSSTPIKKIELWNGAYVGLHVSSGSGKMNERYNNTTVTNNNSTFGLNTSTSVANATTISSAAGTLTGSEADAYIGYNWHHHDSRWILSGQLEGSVFAAIFAKSVGLSNQITTTLQQSFNSGVLTTSTITNGLQTARLQRNVNIQSLFSFLGRGGFLWHPNVYSYGLLGGAEAQMTNPDLTDNGAKRNWWVLGWSTGAGLEYKITEHWSFLGEYRYSMFQYTLHWNNPASTSNTQPNQISTSSSNSYITTQESLALNLGTVGIVYRM